VAGLTLDTGALIAADRGDRVFFIFLKEATRRAATITVPAGALAQAWRGNNARLARLLKACVVEPLDERTAREIGTLLAEARTRDVVDASVVVAASRRGDAILTSDESDISHLVSTLGSHNRVLEI